MTRPRVFIVSTVEGLPVARAIKEALFHEADGYLWSEPGIFDLSEVRIDCLAKALDLFSYAVVVLTPDDLTERRGIVKAAPRDNLVFELGMFVGRYGRDSAYMVAPYGQELLTPSDLDGVVPAFYKPGALQGVEGADVGGACSQILRAIRTSEQHRLQGRFSAQEKALFWDDLAGVVAVVFGAEPTPEVQLGEHPRVSLRDLEAAQMITSFLLRRDPRRKVLSFPAATAGLEGLLRTEADLILIGGFGSNVEFARHRDLFRDNLRLKQGRLCRIDGQKVFHIGFGRLPPGVTPPPRTDPGMIGRFASEFVRHDFGLVYSARKEVYGAERRVIAIAGVKGNGTRGAASCLTQAATHRNVLNGILTRQGCADDLLEMVVAVDVFNDSLNRAEVLQVLVNGSLAFDGSEGLFEECELGRPCVSCRFGEEEELAALPVS